MDPQCHYHRIFFFSLFEVVPSKLNNTDFRVFPSSLAFSSFSNSFWTSPRTISTAQLHMLPHFHLQPINRFVFPGPYFFRMGNLVLKGASRLDAFSVYPVRTWLPCHALGRTTGAPAVRPSRSSRTKDSSPQISYARDR